MTSVVSPKCSFYPLLMNSVFLQNILCPLYVTSCHQNFLYTSLTDHFCHKIASSVLGLPRSWGPARTSLVTTETCPYHRGGTAGSGTRRSKVHSVFHAWNSSLFEEKQVRNCSFSLVWVFKEQLLVALALHIIDACSFI